MRPRTKSSEAGAATVRNLFLLCLALAAGYAGWVYVPAYADGVVIERAARVYANRILVGKGSPGALKTEFLGQVKKQTGLKIHPSSVFVNREGADAVTIRFKVKRPLAFPLLKVERTYPIHVDMRVERE